MKKSILYLSFIFVLVFTLCSCGTTSTGTNNQSNYNDSDTKQEACSHSWENATCTTPKKCSICGETEGDTIAHNFSDATCTTPKKCSVCGETEGDTIAHNYSSGKCTMCGQGDPNAAKIKEALEKSERYVNYMDIEADIILNKIELYRINGKASLLIEMQESVIEIDSYYAKIYEYCHEYRELYPLYSECDKDMPIFSSSSLAKLKTYATQAGRLKSVYDIMCSYYK